MTKQKATAARFRTFRRKNPPHSNVFSTLIQTGTSSNKIAGAFMRQEFGMKTALGRGIGLRIELFFLSVAKEADTNV
jgi:hypothetical protein